MFPLQSFLLVSNCHSHGNLPVTDSWNKDKRTWIRSLCLPVSVKIGFFLFLFVPVFCCYVICNNMNAAVVTCGALDTLWTRPLTTESWWVNYLLLLLQRLHQFQWVHSLGSMDWAFMAVLWHQLRKRTEDLCISPCVLYVSNLKCIVIYAILVLVALFKQVPIAMHSTLCPVLVLSMMLTEWRHDFGFEQFEPWQLLADEAEYWLWALCTAIYMLLLYVTFWVHIDVSILAFMIDKNKKVKTKKIPPHTDWLSCKCVV